MLFTVQINCRDGRVFKFKMLEKELIKLQRNLEYSQNLKIERVSIPVREIDSLMAEVA